MPPAAAPGVAAPAGPVARTAPLATPRAGLGVLAAPAGPSDPPTQNAGVGAVATLLVAPIVNMKNAADKDAVAAQAASPLQ